MCGATIVAADRLAQGLEYCSDHGLELFRLYLLSHRARLHLAPGRWAQAAETADVVLRIPRTSIMPRIIALTVLGLVRARRGDPGHRPLLDEAWDLADQPVRYIGLVPWRQPAQKPLGSGATPIGVASATELALRAGVEMLSGPCRRAGVWRHRAGLGAAKPVVAGSPHGLQLAGCWDAARALWAEAGCPYEAALCLADADDEAPLRLASGGAAGARGPSGCCDRGQTTAPPRRDVVAARAARHDPPEPVRAHCPRGGGPDVIERRLAEQPDRRPARGLREDSRAPRRSYPPQARGQDSRRRAGHRHLARDSCRRILSWGRTRKGAPEAGPTGSLTCPISWESNPISGRPSGQAPAFAVIEPVMEPEKANFAGDCSSSRRCPDRVCDDRHDAAFCK